MSVDEKRRCVCGHLLRRTPGGWVHTAAGRGDCPGGGVPVALTTGVERAE